MPKSVIEVHGDTTKHDSHTEHGQHDDTARYEQEDKCESTCTAAEPAVEQAAFNADKKNHRTKSAVMCNLDLFSR